MLSETVQSELRQELDRLSGIRQAADRQIAAIRALLNGQEPPAEHVDAQQSGDGNGTLRMTLGRQIAAALSEIGHAATTGEIVQVLERCGVVAKGKIDLHTLVSSELWRLDSKKIHVKRVRHGVYGLLGDGGDK